VGAGHQEAVHREHQDGVSNERGVLAKIAAVIAETDSNIDNVSLEPGDSSAYTIIHFTLQVSNRLHLAQIMRGLRRVPNHPHLAPQGLTANGGASAPRTIIDADITRSRRTHMFQFCIARIFCARRTDLACAASDDESMPAGLACRHARTPGLTAGCTFVNGGQAQPEAGGQQCGTTIPAWQVGLFEVASRRTASGSATSCAAAR